MPIMVKGKLAEEITNATLNHEIEWEPDEESGVWVAKYKNFRMGFNWHYVPEVKIDTLNLMLMDDGDGIGSVRAYKWSDDRETLSRLYNFLKAELDKQQQCV